MAHCSVQSVRAEDQARIRRPGPKTARGVYGFMVYLTARGLCFLFIAWAITPQAFLDEHGLDDFFPSKYWALALPVWLIVGTCFIWIIYAAINGWIASETGFWESLSESDKIKNIIF